MSFGLIFLAGGKGTRMGLEMPKQFLNVKNRPLALHSLSIFQESGKFKEIVIVVDPLYQELFPNHKYAMPGVRRQDSVFNGLQILDQTIEYVCIHDAARPFISLEMIENVLLQAAYTGASAAAVPLKFSVKIADEKGRVKSSLDRSTVWEIQTPQAVRRDLLNIGFSIANEQNITVTDDVGLVELFDHPVQLVMGSHKNLKLTTPEDIVLAELLAK